MENEIVLAERKISKLAEDIEETVNQAKALSASLTFPNLDEYKSADMVYNELHRAWKAGEEERKSFTAPINETLDKINGVFQPKLKLIDSIKKNLKSSMDQYATHEMIWKRKEQAKIDAEARKIEDDRLRLAKEMESKGHSDFADILKTSVDIKPVIVKAATDEGKSTIKTTWKAEIMDFKKFLSGVIDGSVPVSMISINLAALDRAAADSKGTLGYPGVTCSEIASIGARR